jgi:signal transduction histidine kinase
VTLAARIRRRLDMPLAMQILGLLAAGLVVAQLVTLFLTLLLPPAPPPEYRLTDIAAALKGGRVDVPNMRPLVRTVRARPPSLQSTGWLVSEQSQVDLARLLGADPADVRLLFYSPLPFVGAPPPRPFTVSDAGLERGRLRLVQASFVSLIDGAFQLAQAGPGPGGRGGGFPGGGVPGGGFPTGRGPGGDFPGQMTGDGPGSPPSQTQAPADRQAAAAGRYTPQASPTPMGPIGRPPLAGGPVDPARDALSRAVFRDRGPYGDWSVTGAQPAAAAAPASAPARVANAAPSAAVATRPTPAPAKPTPGPVAAADAGQPVVQAALAAPPPAPPPARTGWVLPPPVSRGLFGPSPPGFVQADFVAALQVAPNRWVTVQPAPEPFPNRWQRRLLLWFALSFAIVAPIGYLFARRLVAPLGAFSTAAERLGRDPSGPLLALEGPAEIGRAAAAFNLMQQRLKRYIDDRTAMVGAISHDLRTPLARIRFRVERVPPGVRAGILGDVTQMEEMISAVLIFIRDASEPGVRERVDLRSIVECAVDDAALVGGDAVLDPGAPTSVEVDPLGVQRVVTNLIENALKYGNSARVRVFTEGDESITEIADSGPGLAEEELERVFLPFYRAALARTLHEGGIGLGLAVSRSIARAHGGDVRLFRNGGEGLVAQLRLPLADAV